MAQITLSPPDLAGTELAMLTDAVASNWIAPLGPHVDAFEAEMAARLDVPHAVATSSGTAALHLALLVLGVGPGDEVLAVDPDLRRDRQRGPLRRRHPGVRRQRARDLEPRPRAAGRGPRRRRPPRPAAARRRSRSTSTASAPTSSPSPRPASATASPLIEDAAEALGATYRGRPAGSFGDLAILSFNGNKIITTSGGGMLLGRDRALVDRARFLATQAREPARHYEHRVVGYNYRLSNLLAAVGRAQLADLDRRVDARRATNAFYREALGDLPGWALMPEAPGHRATFWLTCATIDPAAFGADRDAVIDHLASGHIEARPVWKPMHLQPVFDGCRVLGGAVAEDLFARGICLPSGSGLSDDDRARVAAAVRSTPRSGR